MGWRGLEPRAVRREELQKTPCEHLFAPYIPCAPPPWGIHTFRFYFLLSSRTWSQRNRTARHHRNKKQTPLIITYADKPARPWRGRRHHRRTPPHTTITHAASGATPTSTSYCFMPTMGIGRFLLTLRACYTTASAKPTSRHVLRSVDTPQLYSCTNKSKTFPFIPDGITVGLADGEGIEPSSVLRLRVKDYSSPCTAILATLSRAYHHPLRSLSQTRRLTPSVGKRFP